ncbi:MAG: cytochrome c oxidase subunit II [Anaerolineae bacterium]|jgi:cytochrome c oxidase subunit 2|nr:cytochrome c oxidase subunit II [Anaerolineae bacterium]
MDVSKKPGSNGQIPLLPIALAVVAILLGGFVIGATTGAIFPVQASTAAYAIDQLFFVLLTIGGMVFLLVQGLLYYSAIRFRVNDQDTEDGPNFHGNATLEFVWTGIPSVIVVVLVFYSWSVWNQIQAPQPNETTVHVLGQRFNWVFTYSDPLGRLEQNPDLAQTFTSNQMYTYVGQPILLQIDALDVNHAFWVPTMRIKQDALVGRQTELRFTPTREGRYRVVCAELCGGGHGAMYTYINVFPDEETYLREFVDPQVNFILNPPDDPVLRAPTVLANYPCSGCHVLDSLGWVGIQGPSMNNMADTAVRRATTYNAPSPEYYIAHSIRWPNDDIVPGFNAGVMPQFGASESEPAQVEGAYYRYMPDEDLIAITAYLCTQTTAPESPCGDLEAIRVAVEEQR